MNDHREVAAAVEVASAWVLSDEGTEALTAAMAASRARADRLAKTRVLTRKDLHRRVGPEGRRSW